MKKAILGFVISTVLVAGCLITGIAGFTCVGQKAIENSTAHDTSERAGVNQYFDIADVSVMVKKFSVGAVKIRDFRKEYDADGPFSVVEVEISTANKTKRFHYTSWTGNQFSIDARVRDDFGNNYKACGFSPLGDPVGHIRGASVEAGKPVNDVLVFEAPIDAATHFDLDLPGKNLGVEGTFGFRLPISRESK